MHRTTTPQTLRVWEYGIPVQIKYIADPSMHSMPAVAVHPNSAQTREAAQLSRHTRRPRVPVGVHRFRPELYLGFASRLSPFPSPAAQWLAAQSMDNQIVIYSCKERFRLNSKKHFAGHSNSGYACQVNFSPDGKYLLSGDGDGKLFIWDWKARGGSRGRNGLSNHLFPLLWCPLSPLSCKPASSAGRCVSCQGRERLMIVFCVFVLLPFLSFFRDPQTSKIYRTIKAHDEVCIGVEWHPLESSKVATCSWDGTIKYWD